MRLIYLLVWLAVVFYTALRRLVAWIAGRKLYLPYPANRELHATHVRSGCYVMLIFGTLSQLVIGWFAASVWGRIDGPTVPLVLGLIAFALFCGVADWRLWREMRSTAPGSDGGCIAWLFWIGFVAGPATLWLLALKIGAISTPALHSGRSR